MVEMFLNFGSGTSGPFLTVQAEEVKVTDAPKHSSTTGYGNKVPTQYMLKYRNVWRRVYCSIWSNCGSLWVTVDGERVSVVDY